METENLPQKVSYKNQWIAALSGKKTVVIAWMKVFFIFNYWYQEMIIVILFFLAHKTWVTKKKCRSDVNFCWIIKLKFNLIRKGIYEW